MSTGTTHDFPACLERLRRRFDRWRQTCDGRSRIPEALWASAVKAAVRHGLNPTVRALRLDYYALKKRVEAAGSRRVPEKPVIAPFVEWVAPLPACSPECLLEWENRGGAKMRVHLKGAAVPDLTALSRSFWDNPT
jgi:hypothetical protein